MFIPYEREFNEVFILKRNFIAITIRTRLLPRSLSVPEKALSGKKIANLDMR